MQVNTNASSLILNVRLVDDAGAAVVGVAHNSADLQVSYKLQAAAGYASPTLVAGTLGTYLANSWVELGQGVYQWCPPDAVVVAGTRTLVRVTYAANKPQLGEIAAIEGGDTWLTDLPGDYSGADAGAMLAAIKTQLDAIAAAGGVVEAGGINLGIATAAASPKMASGDGVSVTNHSLPDLIAAEKHVAAKAAAAKAHRGLRFTKLVPPGTIAD